ncbi:MAG: hypothetical protein ACRDP7_42645 [Trebonia sp.]
MPGELPGRWLFRRARNLPGGQAAGGDAEVAQGRVKLADGALVSAWGQGPRPGAGGGPAASATAWAAAAGG